MYCNADDVLAGCKESPAPVGRNDSLTPTSFPVLELGSDSFAFLTTYTRDYGQLLTYVCACCEMYRYGQINRGDGWETGSIARTIPSGPRQHQHPVHHLIANQSES